MAGLAGSSKLLRAMNESAALELLLDPGMLTRADLRRRTALSTPTISDLLRRLTAAGLITVAGHASGRPGPNAEIYAANLDAAFVAAISIREPRASESRTSESRPGESRPGESRPGESRPGVSRPGVSRPGESRPGGSRPGGSRPGESRTSESKPGESKPSAASTDKAGRSDTAAGAGEVGQGDTAASAGRTGQGDPAASAGKTGRGYTAASDTAVGSTPTVSAAICDLSGKIRCYGEWPTTDFGADPVSIVEGVVVRLAENGGVRRERISHVHLGVPGAFDLKNEVIRLVDVPGFDQPGLVSRIAERLKIRVGVDNDVNLAAVAERRRGAGRETDNFALLWIGTDGLGLAIDIGGQLLRGTRGAAGEIGYVPIHPRRTLQDLFGGPAIMELARTHNIEGNGPAAVVATGTDHFRAALAERIVIGLAAVTAILDPYLIVLAGPIAQAGGEPLLTAVTSAFRTAAPLESAIVITSIDGDAVLLGALDAGLAEVRKALVARAFTDVGLPPGR